jgi:hypothetical protein
MSQTKETVAERIRREETARSQKKGLNRGTIFDKQNKRDDKSDETSAQNERSIFNRRAQEDER